MKKYQPEQIVQKLRQADLVGYWYGENAFMGTSQADILIIDDDQELCDAISVRFGAAGLNCVALSDSEEGKRLLGRKRFVVVVSDIAMPGISGLDLIAHVKRSKNPGCKVILITGLRDTECLTRALILGAYDYHEKPIDMGELIESVKSALAEGSVSLPPLPTKAASAMQAESKLKEVSFQSIRAVVRAVEAKDLHTRRHSEQVTHYAVNLAKRLNVSGYEIESIRIASLVHDVGKIGVPDSILTKARQLTDEEFELIRRHPATGAEILETIAAFTEEARLVRFHHERWDGTGYPYRIGGEEIPVGARIINVADSIDAMLMWRSYEEAYTLEKMLSELERCSGTQFDPEVAAAAVEWCKAHPDKLIFPGREGPTADQLLQAEKFEANQIA